jgi:UDP-glucose 4-epimerase
MFSLKGRHIVVVGGAGFVGSNLCHALVEHHAPASLMVVDNMLSADASNLIRHPTARLVMGSIADPNVLKELPVLVDVVFHLACYHGNQSSIADPEADHANNTLTSLRLFHHLSRLSNPPRVVYAAAGCAVARKTYDEAEATAEDAEVSLFHDSPYSISKLIGELYGNYFLQRARLPFIRARFQNVYGPREILGAGQWRGTPHTVWRNVIPTFVWKAIHGEPLTVHNGGNAGRDFIFVDDIVRGLIACAEHGDPGEAYNLATGAETLIGELAELINGLTGNQAGLALEGKRDWDRSGRRFGSTGKSLQRLGFQATVPLEEGLSRTIAWTRANREHIAATIARHDAMMAQFARSGG